MNKAEIMTRIASAWVSSSNADIDKLNSQMFIDKIESVADRILARCPDPFELAPEKVEEKPRRFFIPVSEMPSHAEES